MNNCRPCPFCGGGQPVFEGDAAEWKDDRRYVQLSLTCCATMIEGMGWKQARELTVSERETVLHKALADRWNVRCAQNPE